VGKNGWQTQSIVQSVITFFFFFILGDGSSKEVYHTPKIKLNYFLKLKFKKLDALIGWYSKSPNWGELIECETWNWIAQQVFETSFETQLRQ
jgi:hypothetical protein